MYIHRFVYFSKRSTSCPAPGSWLVFHRRLRSVDGVSRIPRRMLRCDLLADQQRELRSDEGRWRRRRGVVRAGVGSPGNLPQRRGVVVCARRWRRRGSSALEVGRCQGQVGRPHQRVARRQRRGHQHHQRKEHQQRRRRRRDDVLVRGHGNWLFSATI
uniref:Uncharacterized protein n=1 Tax=Setaria italica TaxID=4555 RepID=K3ZAD9_SETIT